MKNNFLSGLALLTPILIVFFTVKICISLLAAPFYSIIHEVLLAYENAYDLKPSQHKLLTDFLSTSLALFILILLCLILGFFANRFITQFILAKLEKLFKKIPIIKTIFNISKDLSNQFLKKDQTIFKKTVLTHFPGKQTVSLGFLTSDVSGKIKEAAEGLDVCIFVPTSPHPVSGFVLLTSSKEIKEIDVSIDDAFGFILSCGVSPLEESSPKKKGKKSTP